jgi:beta-mannosidase
MIRTEIVDGWRLTEIPVTGLPAHNRLPSIPATVPGHVHLDLRESGIIPDPFYRLQERDAMWVDDADWVYETEFQVDSLETKNTYLIFHGLDTVAEIALNGEPLGETDNMHIAHEFLVGDRLRVGPGADGVNTVRVTFRSARRVGRERMQAWNAAGNDTMPMHWDFWDSRAFVRKAQYMYGWDWGPVLISCGIWKPVELVQVTTARILDYRYDVTFSGIDAGSAKVDVEVFVERAPEAVNTPLTLTVKLTDASALPITVNVPKGSGRLKATASLEIAHAQRWQPNGLGQSHLYPLELTIESDRICDRLSSTIGLRSVELVREPDPDGTGESFKFRVNGSDVFVKGANWIPSYSFPSVEKIGDQVRAARDAGFNMLRVWGGGLYESEEFYRECDRNGIMVWQDFAYGCSYYPDTGDYAESAGREAVENVRRLRSHPSLVIWCGNNENHMMYHQDWGSLKPARYLGEAIYHEILPQVIDEEDPGTLYWPSSPFGGNNPNSEDCGDQHNWDVWHGRGDWVHYAENKSRFVSEFGFAASCGLAAWNTCLADSDRSARSAAVRWHDKTRKGYDTYFQYIAKHFPVPETLEDLVYYSQLNQAEALKFGIEHYRRLKGRCWGTIFWQLNDCWPVQSWAIIDSLGEPKAAYYASKRFYAPVLLSLVRKDGLVEAHLVNDHLSEIEGKLRIALMSMNGDILAEAAHDTGVAANGNGLVGSLSLTAATGRERDVLVYATFTTAQVDTVENTLLLVEPKELRPVSTPISVSIIGESRGEIVLELSAKRFVPYVWLRSSDNAILRLGDNFFHLLPGRPRQVAVRADDLDAEGLLDRLVVTSLTAAIEIAPSTAHLNA